MKYLIAIAIAAAISAVILMTPTAETPPAIAPGLEITMFERASGTGVRGVIIACDEKTQTVTVRSDDTGLEAQYIAAGEMDPDSPQWRRIAKKLHINPNCVAVDLIKPAENPEKPPEPAL